MVADSDCRSITEESPVLSLCTSALRVCSAEHYRQGSRSGLRQDSPSGRPTLQLIVNRGWISIAYFCRAILSSYDAGEATTRAEFQYRFIAD